MWNSITDVVVLFPKKSTKKGYEILTLLLENNHYIYLELKDLKKIKIGDAPDRLKSNIKQNENITSTDYEERNNKVFIIDQLSTIEEFNKRRKKY